MEHRAGVRLHRDPVRRAQDIEIQRRHQSGQRGGGGLVPADFQTIAVGAQMVGVVDHPTGKPQDLAFKGAKQLQFPAPGGSRIGLYSARRPAHEHLPFALIPVRTIACPDRKGLPQDEKMPRHGQRHPRRRGARLRVTLMQERAFTSAIFN